MRAAWGVCIRKIVDHIGVWVDTFYEAVGAWVGFGAMIPLNGAGWHDTVPQL